MRGRNAIMNDDHDALYLRTLREEEEAGLRAIAFWEEQAAVEFTQPGWVGLHLEDLKRQLDGTREAIRLMEAKNTGTP